MCFCVAVLTGEAANSPDDRQITDPKSIGSRSNAKAGPLAIDELFYSRTVSAPSWSPNGREIVFTTNLTGRMNLWKVSADGGWPIQLSQSDDREMRASWSTDGKWIVFDQDYRGGEYYDLFAIPASGGEAVNLTNTKEVSESYALWSPDSASIAFIRKLKTSAASDIAVLNWSTRGVRQLTHEQADYGWAPVAWTPDGHHLFAQRSNVSGTDSSVYRIEVATGNLEELTPHKGKIVYAASSASPDGKLLLLNSNEKRGFDNVALLDVISRKLTWITDLQWDATAGGYSPKGDYFTYRVNEDGRTELYIVDTASLRPVKVEFPKGVSTFEGRPSSFSPSGDRVVILHQSSQKPPDLWIYDIRSRSSRQLTYSALAGLDSDRIPPSQLVHYRSFDGKIISAFAWLPDNMRRDASHPAIVLPHGGPTAQAVDSFNRLAAAFASRGYVCIAPNVRGSTGYGMEFQEANHMDLGGGDLQDEVYAAKFLTETGYVDQKRIGITGGSYGGYMTLMAIGKTPDLWRAAVEQYGIVNWFTMIQHQDPVLQAYQRSLIGDPVRDRKVYEEDSPLTYLRKAKAPLLVLHGDNDIRVPKEEAMQVVDILEKAGNVVAAHYYANEGHGFVKRENQIDAIQRTIDWFDRYLKGSQQ